VAPDICGEGIEKGRSGEGVEEWGSGEVRDVLFHIPKTMSTDTEKHIAGLDALEHDKR